MPTLPRLLFGNFSLWLWTVISLFLFLWELPFCLFYESMKTIICGLWNIHIGPGHLRNSVTSSLLIAHSLPPFLTTDVTTPRTICTYNFAPCLHRSPSFQLITLCQISLKGVIWQLVICTVSTPMTSQSFHVLVLLHYLLTLYYAILQIVSYIISCFRAWLFFPRKGF